MFKKTKILFPNPIAPTNVLFHLLFLYFSLKFMYNLRIVVIGVDLFSEKASIMRESLHKSQTITCYSIK
jgi:hypothetical protein